MRKEGSKREGMEGKEKRRAKNGQKQRREIGETVQIMKE